MGRSNPVTTVPEERPARAAANAATDSVRLRLPPGPPLPRSVQSYLYFRNRLRFVERCRARYGEVFTLAIHDYPRLVYFAEPDVAREIQTGDPALFHSADHGLLTVGGQGSIFVLDEDDHLCERRLFLPPLHGKALEAHRATIREVVERNLDGWPLGRPFALRPRFQQITLEVVMRSFFGIVDRERLREIYRMASKLFDIGAAAYLPLLRTDALPGTAWRRRARVLRALDEIAYAEIARRWASGARDGGDLLSLLMQAHDEHGRPPSAEKLRDQIVSIMFAGQETTASALSWIMLRLGAEPEVAARVLAEADRGEDAYLDAVIKECLRLNPPIMESGRRLTRPARLAGWDIPAGTFVMASHALVQRAERLHPDPLLFHPERFLDGGVAPFTHMPFGLGHRRCLGSALATLEIKIAVLSALRRFELRPAGRAPERPRIYGFALGPSRGAKMVVTHRARSTGPGTL